MQALLSKDIELKVDQLGYLGPIDLTQYFIQSISLLKSKLSPDGSAGVQVHIVLKRRILSDVLTTILPTILIIIVSFSTTFYNVMSTTCFFHV